MLRGPDLVERILLGIRHGGIEAGMSQCRGDLTQIMPLQQGAFGKGMAHPVRRGLAQLDHRLELVLVLQMIHRPLQASFYNFENRLPGPRPGEHLFGSARTLTDRPKSRGRSSYPRWFIAMACAPRPDRDTSLGQMEAVGGDRFLRGVAVNQSNGDVVLLAVNLDFKKIEQRYRDQNYSTC